MIKERCVNNVKKLFYNGTILTMDEKMPKVAAVAIEEERIIQVYNEVPLDWKYESCDLEGKTLLPGFIDGHSHLVGCANSLAQCDLSKAKNFYDIVDIMKQFIKDRNIPKGKWVVGINYDHNFLKEKRHPDCNVLNEISKNHAILIIHVSNHMGVVNSFGLCKENVYDDVKDPQGGRYGRFDGTNTLNGYMEENAFINFQKSISSLDIEMMRKNIILAQELYAKYGITTIQDGFLTDSLYSLLKLFAEEKLLKIDVVGYVDLENYRNIYQKHSKDYVYNNHFRLGGYKIFLDGSPQGKTAWMKEPYEHSKERGYPVHSDEDIYELISNALEDHAQLLAHCNGDAAAEQYVKQFTRVMENHSYIDSYRPVMIHAQLVREEELRKMERISMIPSFFVAHTYYWGDIHLANLGKERASRISPVKDAIRTGLTYTFHQDTPVLFPDVMKTISCAVNRITKNGIGLSKDQSISVMEALKAVTIYAAYQYHEENSKGSIEKGKKANFVILEKNPLEVELSELENIQVVETIVDGVTIFKK